MSSLHEKLALKNTVVQHVATIFLSVLAVAAIGTGVWLWWPSAAGPDAMARGVSIGGVDVSGMTREEAQAAISRRTAAFPLSFDLRDVHASFRADGDDGTPIAVFDPEPAVNLAFSIGREQNRVRGTLARGRAAAFGANVPMQFTLDRVALRGLLEEAFADGITPARNATVAVNIEGGEHVASVVPGANGTVIDYDDVMKQVSRRLAALSDAPVRVVAKNGPPEIQEQDVQPLLDEAVEAATHGPLSLSASDEGWTVSGATLADWIAVGLVDGKPGLTINAEKAGEFLTARAKSITTQPKDAAFEEKDGKVTTFVPGVNGTTLDVDGAITAIAAAVFGQPGEDGKEPWKKTVALPMKDVEPELTTEESNPYGIKELIGIGSSNFKGSPTNRRHNIAVGAASVNGTLVPAGEEFSMLKTLGTIDGTTGYRQELVIKGNETKPEYGGGLCQIGSTAFRGALDSGLLITERRNHSYRVPYYERAGDGSYIGPGKDATIYDPAPDFRFRNDTAHAILITTKITGDRLDFLFWGVKDGRTSSQTDSRVYNIVQPPEKKLVETDTLKPGEEKCTEKPHVGSDAVFSYTVTYGDGTEKKTDFYSHYRPWQEVCLVGKDPNAPPAPDANADAPADGIIPASPDAAGVTGT